MIRFAHIAISVIVLLLSTKSWSQRPIINSIDKTIASPGSVVNITGNSFGTDPSKLKVMFGGAAGEVLFASDQLLEVKVPGGATYDEVSVTYIPSGLTSLSKENLLMSFGGAPGITATSFDAQLNFDAESGLYDLCSCDFDGDGKLDFATANQNVNSITILKNKTLLPGQSTISFEKQNILLNARTIHSICGDINGDGKPDLIFSDAVQDSDKLYFLRNTSSGPGNFSFSTTVQSVPGKKVKQMRLVDLDGDGKPELTISSQNSNSLSILRNQSTTSSISFAAVPVQLNNIGNSSIGTDGIDIHDLDGDGFPDIVSGKFQNQDKLYIHRNISTPGNISFESPISLNINASMVNIRIGDLDGDAKPDIAVTQLLSPDQIERVIVFLNETSGNTISFSNPHFITTGQRFWGLDFGDLDGDGKTDIVACSITKKELTILRNTSSPGSLNFQSSIKETEFVTRHVAIGDVDGDAKPDIVFTSIDFNDIPASKISIFRNRICQQPEIEPTEPETICVGTPFQLTTTGLPGTTYTWQRNGSTISTGSNAFINADQTGEYKVIATTAGCSRISSPRILNVEPGSLSSVPTLDDMEPLCEGSTLNLSITPSTDTNVTYEWTGPSGYTGQGSTPDPIENFGEANTGRYKVKIFVGECLAKELSTVVEAISLDGISINVGGSSIVCAPDTKTLTVSPARTDFTYQWLKDEIIISGANATSFQATETGSYSVAASYTPNPACAAIESTPVDIKFAVPIIADFLVQDFSCSGEQITFVNQSTKDPSITTHYSWNFGNTQTATTKDGTTTYLSAGSFPVKLTVSYDNGACQDESTKILIVKQTPSVTLSATDNRFAFCKGGETELRVSGVYQSYEWNTNESGPAIMISDPGLYSVTVLDPNGCYGTVEQEVSEFDAPEIVLSASPEMINEGETSQLFVSGLEDFIWAPEETLDNATSISPIATPTSDTYYIVEGFDNNGCFGKDSIKVRVNSGSIYPKLNPQAFFSPNGDATGNLWIVERMDEFPGCQVTIYDDKGVQVFAAKPYLNNWDGTVNGRPVPDGVYYFIIKCDGDKNPPRTGSITLLR